MSDNIWVFTSEEIRNADSIESLRNLVKERILEKQEAKPLAYCYCQEGKNTWFTYCPDCFTNLKIEESLGEADAIMTSLNGDVMKCGICSREIRG
jgi:hypothetical protein